MKHAETEEKNALPPIEGLSALFCNCFFVCSLICLRLLGCFLLFNIGIKVLFFYVSIIFYTIFFVMLIFKYFSNFFPLDAGYVIK